MTTTRRRRSRRSIKALSERAAQRPLALGVVALMALAILTYVSWVVAEGVPFLQRASVRAIVPAQGPTVRKGDEVRVGGKRAGKVTEVDAVGDGRMLHMKLYEDDPIYSDARVSVQVRGLAGAVHIDLLRGSKGRKLEDDGLIPLRQAEAGEDLATVAAGFGPEARKALGTTLQSYGGGLVGTGEPLNRALTDLEPLNADGTKLLRALTPQPGALGDVFGSLDGVVRGFAGQRPGDLAGFLDSGASAGPVLADKRAELGETIDQARPTEDEALRTLPTADALLADVGDAADDLTPGIAALQRSLPRVNRLLDRREALGRVSRLTRSADPVLVRARPLLGELRPFAATVDPLLAPGVPLAQRVNAYRKDIVGGFDALASSGQHTYAIGGARGTRAIRFTPIFTCMPGRNPYPAPGAVRQDRTPC